MLSDRERKTLRELERQFRADDPAFSRSFDVRARRTGRSRIGTAAAVVTAVLVVALMLVSGSLGGALALAVVTGLLWLAWHRAAQAGGPPDGRSDGTTIN